MAEVKPNKKQNDESNGQISIGTIVSVLSHPYSFQNKNVKIAAYARMTPPLMTVLEIHYGTKYNPTDGEKENKDSFRCLYYSTVNGCYETNWFKRQQLKPIEDGDTSLSSEYKLKPIDSAKKELLGKQAVLTTVDLELGKVKVWHNADRKRSRSKESNLLDYLPPVGSIVDVKLVEDYQKYDEKNGKPLFKKSKVSAKLRWLNNLTTKFSEEYIPLSALKLVEETYHEFDRTCYVRLKQPFELEDNKQIIIKALPLRPKEVLWKHYYYEYIFDSLFSDKTIPITTSEIKSLHELSKANQIFNSEMLNDKIVSEYFVFSNKSEIEGSWFEIEYSDGSGRYTRRIVFIQEILDDLEIGEGKQTKLLKSNCLLRNGKIRHFRVDRIRRYRKMPNEFVEIFIEDVKLIG